MRPIEAHRYSSKPNAEHVGFAQPRVVVKHNWIIAMHTILRPHVSEFPSFSQRKIQYSGSRTWRRSRQHPLEAILLGLAASVQPNGAAEGEVRGSQGACAAVVLLCQLSIDQPVVLRGLEPPFVLACVRYLRLGYHGKTLALSEARYGETVEWMIVKH